MTLPATLLCLGFTEIYLGKSPSTRRPALDPFVLTISTHPREGAHLNLLDALRLRDALDNIITEMENRS